LTHRFEAPLWLTEGEGGWHFLTVPPDLSDEVRDAAGARRGFGSVRVRATVGRTSWTTSVFPTKDGCFVLPVKKAVRTAEQVEQGDVLAVALEPLDG
jgi:hypothetical protein